MQKILKVKSRRMPRRGCKDANISYLEDKDEDVFELDEFDKFMNKNRTRRNK